jgi:hypothetical protein
MSQRWRGPDDRGWVTASVAILAVSLLFVTGLVIDGGRRISAYMRASDLAANAARAGAQAADRSVLYESGVTTLDPGEATAAALGFLADAGHPGTGAVDSVVGNQVTVTVTLEHQSIILDWADATVTASATSTATPGVNAPSGGP